MYQEEKRKAEELAKTVESLTAQLHANMSEFKEWKADDELKRQYAGHREQLHEQALARAMDSANTDHCEDHPRRPARNRLDTRK